LGEDFGFAVLKGGQNALIKRIHGTAYAGPDLKPFLTNLGTGMRASSSSSQSLGLGLGLGQNFPNRAFLFSFSEKHLIFMAADVFETSFQKLSGFLNIIGNGGAIFVVVFKLY
jgi:hypothetical protein